MQWSLRAFHCMHLQGRHWTNEKKNTGFIAIELSVSASVWNVYFFNELSWCHRALNLDQMQKKCYSWSFCYLCILKSWSTISSLILQKLKKIQGNQGKGENSSPWSLEDLSPVILHFSFLHNCPCLANQENRFSAAQDIPGLIKIMHMAATRARFGSAWYQNLWLLSRHSPCELFSSCRL